MSSMSVLPKLTMSEMMFTMCRSSKQFEVFNTIVEFISISMMYQFRRKQFSTKMFFHHSAMLIKTIIATMTQYTISKFRYGALTCSNATFCGSGISTMNTANNFLATLQKMTTFLAFHYYQYITATA